MRGVGRLIVLLAILASPVRAAQVQAMVLATHHMANPGLDRHNIKDDDILLPRRQHELAAVTNALARFRPTKIAVESLAAGDWPARVVKYDDYLDRRLATSRNEVVQIGFRLARQVRLNDVWGIDVRGNFPYAAVKRYAATHGSPLPERLDAMNAATEQMLYGLNRVLKTGTVGQALRYLNDPQNIAESNEFYRDVRGFGDGTNQPGESLLRAWQARNNAICAHLVQLAEPSDRIVVVYGAGHAYLLRQCVRDSPGFKLVEANDYLPN